MTGLILKWMRFQKEAYVLFLMIVLGIVGYGAYAAFTSEIIAFPEFTNVQVQVQTQWPGHSAEEIERLITVPLETATRSTPGVINSNSLSEYGLSSILLTFNDDVPDWKARTDTTEYMSNANLPNGISPGLNADATATGQFYRFYLDGDLPVDEMRLYNDWEITRALEVIPGVADVETLGGPVKVVMVKINQAKMKAYGLTIAQIAQNLGNNHQNAGGDWITHGQECYIVRSMGLYADPVELENAVIATQNSTPVRIRDIGRVVISHHQRLGQSGQGLKDDIVRSLINVRVGANELDTLDKIHAMVKHLNEDILPKGCQIVPFYDRGDLIHRSSRTVFHNVLFGVGLVCLLLILGFGIEYWAMSAGVALIIPFALLMAFVGLHWFGYNPNLISLGAVDFGIIVETAVFGAEALTVTLAKQKRKDDEANALALSEVLAPALLCAFLLLIAFIPILSLERIEGRIFRPLGLTLVSALAGGQLGAFIFLPLAATWAPVGVTSSKSDAAFHWILTQCNRIMLWLDSFKYTPWVAGIVLAGAIFGLNYGLGTEFLPHMNEGNLWIRYFGPPTISREKAVQVAHDIRVRMMRIPEVKSVISSIGRPDDGSDINGLDCDEIQVDLGDPDDWKSADTIEGFYALIQEQEKDIDGIDFYYSQYIKDNVDEAVNGVMSELAFKIHGPDIHVLQQLADQSMDIVAKTPGAGDVDEEQLFEQPELQYVMDRPALDRYGIQVANAEGVLEAALSGVWAAQMLDRNNRYLDMVVKPDLPDVVNQPVLNALPVQMPNGGYIPLGAVTKAQVVNGVSHIYREEGERRIAVKCDCRGRAVVDFVNDANARIKKEVKFPPHYWTEWTGSFANAQRASARLGIIVPICLLVMIGIIYTWFKDWRLLTVLLWEIPFATVGGLAGIRLAGLNLSISAAAGGIIRIGVSFLTAMMIISAFVKTKDASKALMEKGRSILISNGVAIIGLIPAALSHSIGSETARPFAVAILGGLSASMTLSLTLLPVFLRRIEKYYKNDKPAH